jgi:N-acyl-L-homoserine lactone synthetase
MNTSAKNITAHIFHQGTDEAETRLAAKFRKSLFVDNLGWALETQGQLEADEFDRAEATLAVLKSDGEILGIFRAIRTDRPYLAETIFPSLATTRGYPKRPDVWEISRFGVMPGSRGRAAANMLYALMFQFALIRRAKSLVAVTDLFHERYLSVLGIRTRRYGKPQNYTTSTSNDPLQLVAGEIAMRLQDETSLYRLLSNLNGVQIDDKTLVLGRRSLQA